MTLFCGFLVLAPSAATTADGVLRRWVDVLDRPRDDQALLLGAWFSCVLLDVQPAADAAPDADQPLLEAPAGEVAEAEQAEADPRGAARRYPVIDRMKLAMRGTREQRSQAGFVIPTSWSRSRWLSSPKLNDAEIRRVCADGQPDGRRAPDHRHQPRLGEELQRHCRADPESEDPTAIAMNFLQRLNERDLKMLSVSTGTSASRSASRPGSSFPGTSAEFLAHLGQAVHVDGCDAGGVLPASGMGLQQVDRAVGSRARVVALGRVEVEGPR